jgi:HK97 family phage major capsid protein
VSANSNRLVINGVDETSRVAGSRWGGIRGYWAAEAAEKTKSDPKFKRLTLSLNKMIGLCYATDELLQDAAALGSVLMQGFSEEFNFMVDEAILRGSGAGQPLGILNASCLVSVAAETGQDSTTIVAQNIMNMYARLYNRSRPNAVWLINQDCLPQLMQLSIPVGTGGIPLWIAGNSLAGQPYNTLLGRPVIECEHCSTLGTVGDIMLVDLGQYLFIEKGGIQSASSIHVRFVYDETAFRFVWRVDGQPAWTNDLTPAHGSNDVSPFVALATR